MEKVVASLRGHVFVDIGCGDGAYSSHLAKLTGAKKIVGIDHDPRLVKKAKKNQVDVFLEDLNSPLSLKSSMADVVVANQVIEHIAKTDMLMKEVFRILKPGGSAVFCTPNLASWHNIFALIMGWQPFSSQVSDEYFLGNPAHPNNFKKIQEEQAHLRLFTLRSLSDLGKIHHFTVAETHMIGYYPLPSSIAPLFSRIDPIHAAYVLVRFTK